MSSEKILRTKEVQGQTKLGRTTIWRLEREGRFPKRVQLSDRRVGWKASDVEAWVQSRPDAG